MLHSHGYVAWVALENLIPKVSFGLFSVKFDALNSGQMARKWIETFQASMKMRHHAQETLELWFEENVLQLIFFSKWTCGAPEFRRVSEDCCLLTSGGGELPENREVLVGHKNIRDKWVLAFSWLRFSTTRPPKFVPIFTKDCKSLTSVYANWETFLCQHFLAPLKFWSEFCRVLSVVLVSELGPWGCMVGVWNLCLCWYISLIDEIQLHCTATKMHSPWHSNTKKKKKKKKRELSKVTYLDSDTLNTDLQWILRTKARLVRIHTKRVLLFFRHSLKLPFHLFHLFPGFIALLGWDVGLLHCSSLQSACCNTTAAMLTQLCYMMTEWGLVPMA